MNFIEILKAVFFGIIEGITEWLPISSTGHMILLDQFVHLQVSEGFYTLFQVVIQLGAILAVAVIFWNRLWPFAMKERRDAAGKTVCFKDGALDLWLKIIVACIPAAIVGVLPGLDDKIDELFYHPIPVAIALIVVGIVFIVIELFQGKRSPIIESIEGLTYRHVVIIGLFQLLAAVFPGTSRSGATIIGALLIGVSRGTAAEFTFFLAVPVMAGASLLKTVKFMLSGITMTGMEPAILITGMVTAFLVSILVIKFFMGYIKKHDFKMFGLYRIVLGLLVLWILR